MLFFCSQYGGHRSILIAGIIRMASEDAEAATVRRQLLDVEHTKTRAREYLHNGEERQIREMFVISSIELHMLDHAHQVREFERNRSAQFERRFQSRREVIDVGNVRVNVVSNDQVCGNVLASETCGERCAKELAPNGNAERLGGRGGARRGFDAKTRDAGAHEVPEQVTVIR